MRRVLGISWPGCSGTTSKPGGLASRTFDRWIGAMLAEGFVALIALVTVMIVRAGALRGKKAPGTIYGNGIGQFMT